MKHDDPKLTAFALGELSARDIAEMDQLFRTDRDAAAEVQETREFANVLRESLLKEPAGELQPHQRDAIFRAAKIARSQIQPGEVPAPALVPDTSWWNRPGPWQAVAACAITAFAAFLLSSPFGTKSRPQIAGSSEFVVPVPVVEDAKAVAGSGDPELLSPEQRARSGSAPLAKVEGPKLQSPAPRISPSAPNVAIEVPSAPLQASASSQPNVASSEIGKPPTARPPRPPQVVNASGNPQIVDRLAAASIARSENKPGINDELASNYLRERIEESRMETGKTFAEFSRVFRPVAGASGQYEMIRTPSIKVDAEFSSPEGQALTTPPTAESRLSRISKPYLD